jgi:hypothetical protein
MAVNKRTFEVEIDGETVKLAALRPSYAVTQQATLVYNREFRKAVEAGLMVRARIDKVMREQNLWDDEKQAALVRVTRAINEGEKRLAKGGIKLSEAKDVALGMVRARNELKAVLVERNELDQHTAESAAEQGRFSFLVAACTVYSETGKPYYRDAEDYLGREGNDPVALAASTEFGKLYYGLDDDYARKLPESKFLLAHKFVDDNLRLVDRQGRLVDDQGRLVDERGRLVNEAGELVSGDGSLLTEDGEYKVDFVPFIDDVNEPVTPAPEPEGVPDKGGVEAPVAA